MNINEGRNNYINLQSKNLHNDQYAVLIENENTRRTSAYVDSHDDSEVITIREREKRIAEEKVKRQLGITSNNHSLHESEVRSWIKADEIRIEEERKKRIAEEELRKIESLKIVETNDAEIKKEEKISIPIPGKKQPTKSKRRFNKFLSYFLGIPAFLLCMGYLYWIFAPPSENLKSQFAEWMNTNSSKEVNNFLFVTLGFKNYYTPPEIVDYSGIYYNTLIVNDDQTVLYHNGNNLTGKYTLEGKEFLLEGFTDNKGQFLLMETFNGNPSAILKGTVFNAGYLTAERYGQNGEEKKIISLQRDTTITQTKEIEDSE
jgi:hypothetical protein